jgi:hypothetical protein
MSQRLDRGLEAGATPADISAEACAMRSRPTLVQARLLRQRYQRLQRDGVANRVLTPPANVDGVHGAGSEWNVSLTTGWPAR